MTDDAHHILRLQEIEEAALLRAERALNMARRCDQSVIEEPINGEKNHEPAKAV